MALPKNFSVLNRATTMAFKDRLVPINCTAHTAYVGSFVSLRIEDPSGHLTARLADTIIRFVENGLRELGLQIVDHAKPCYHMNGVVVMWPIV